MALRKEDAQSDERLASDAAELLRKRTAQAKRWYEVVRSLRAFYDHFRIAFPHLEELPKSYTDEWATSFQDSARDFVQTEDMGSVRKVLVSAGYGTDKWVQIAEREVAELEDAFSRLLDAVEHAEEEYEFLEEASAELDRVEESDTLENNETYIDLQQRFEDLKKLHHALEAEAELREKHIVELEGQIRRQGDDAAGEDVELGHGAGIVEADRSEVEQVQRRLEKALKENHELQTTIQDQKKRIVELEGQLRRRDRDGGGTQGAEDLGFGGVVADASESGQLQHRYDALKEDHQSALEKLEKREEEVRALSEQLKKLSATETTASSETVVERKIEAPSAMAAQLREQDQKLKASELMINGLRSELEREQKNAEEFRDDVKRERDRRRLMEEELENDRVELRQQVNRLKAVLARVDMPSLEEFEEMSAEELLTHIEDVEAEKQRAMAGIEAMEVQEEGYRKQLEVQESAISNIQEDLEKYKDTNLASEMEGARKTIDTQREQLEQLVGLSKTLKAQVAHLKQRQEPLRELVEKLNDQEKSLIRYIRMNYDQRFMPTQAYDE